MLYRRFWLTNAKGDSWTFSNQEIRSFLCDPEGLGFKKSMDLIRYGERLKVDAQYYDFPEPSGEVLFCDSNNADRYRKYHLFSRFLMEEPLTLYYELPLETPVVFSLECKASKLTKTESTAKKMLICSIEFQGLGFWKGTPVTLTGSSSSYSLVNNGQMPVGFEITLTGISMENPYFTLEQNSEVYGEAKFYDGSNLFNKVYVDSIDGEQNVELEQGGSVLPNPLSYQDLSISNGSIYVTFVKIARGTSTLTIGMDSGSLTSAAISFTPIYRSV